MVFSSNLPHSLSPFMTDDTNVNNLNFTGEDWQNLRDRGYRYLPLIHRLYADYLTPVGAFTAVGGQPYSFLLESVEKGMNVGRHSFIGFDPLLTVRAGESRVEVKTGEQSRVIPGGDPLDILKCTLSELKVAPVDNFPVFHGGAVGYLGYDYVRFLEAIPALKPDHLHLGPAWWMVPGKMLIFDHVTREVFIVVLASVVAADGYSRAVAEIKDIRRRLNAGGNPKPPERVSYPEPAHIVSSFSPEEYMRAVERAREYIFAGDIFQVVLSQRLSFPFTGDPFALYRVLRSVNPSPYLFYLHCGDHQVVGSSPEMMVRLNGDVAEVRPIAGTRPRFVHGRSEESLISELLGNEKERSEHLMLVDLGRNDLGRVCRYGTVKVEDFMTVERYSHVLHLVSRVTGSLRPEMDGFSLLKAVFPAGTLTGAPKVRAMEIIEELEPSRRGFYGGAVGYLGFDGQMDTVIAIRSAVAAAGYIHLQAGAGIVADSDPEREYQETLFKLPALLKSFQLLGQGEEEWL